MSEEKTERQKLWLVTLSVETTAYILADSQKEAEEAAKEDASDLFDGLSLSYDSDAYAREVRNPESGEEIWNDDSRRSVRDYMNGVPSVKEVIADLDATKPPAGDVRAYAEWLAQHPDTAAVGDVVYCQHAWLQVDGLDLPPKALPHHAVPLARDKVIGSTAAVGKRHEVQPGAEVMAGRIPARWYGPAAVDREKWARWVPTAHTRVMASGEFDAVQIEGDGWRACIMPVRV